METYQQLKERQQKEFNNLPIKFAFGNEQFKKAMSEIGLKVTDTDKIYGLGGTGGFYKRTDSQKIKEYFTRSRKELKEAMKDKEFSYQAFSYELANHEYVITQDIEETLTALGLEFEDIKNNEELKKSLDKALKKYNK